MDATIIIPTFNRWDALQETLEALARVDYLASSWEVIVIDDGSNDETGQSIRKWIEDAAINVRCLRQTNAGPAAARNRGAIEARGDALIFIDNDILVKPDFVRAHVDALAAHPGCWVMGRVVHSAELRRTPFGRYRDAVWEAFHDARSSDAIAETTGMTAANVSMPAVDFHKLGGFDEDFTIASCEDCELGIRARQAGIRVLYHPGIVALHNDWAVALDRFCERQRLYSISDVLLSRKYGSASPHASLVEQNAPLRLKTDKLGLIVKKAIKRALATPPGSALARIACSLAERMAPDTRLSRRAYDVVVGIAIFKGVREGLRRYGSGASSSHHGSDNEDENVTRTGSCNTVCHLIDANLDTSYFRSIARSHNRDRFPVTIGSLAPQGPLQRAMKERGIATFSLNASNRWEYLPAVFRLAGFLRRHGIAVLHAHCFDPTWVGWIAARLAGVPFVFTRHHSDHNVRMGKRWHTRIDSWCGRRADHVIAVSKATRRVMIEIERVPEDQITVVCNGMEPLRPPTAGQVEAVRRELGLSEQKVCLMLARLHEEKGHRYLFAAIPEIQSRVGPVVFLLAGEGPHRSELEDEVKRRGLENSVRLLGRRDDVPELISLASVVVLPSLAESFGFVLLEAMSLGTPVVAAATGGIPELVTDEENGLLVPPADSRALGNAVSRLLENPELALRMAQHGSTCVGAFSFERMIAGYESIYASIVAATLSPAITSQPSTESARSRTSAG
jgi:glycosyltransferase involved in cell wall biosynthesis/GT2 family glycosyltransferase